jgi:ubiquinone/menaquinone biosynthesis C-methylase UbiE
MEPILYELAGQNQAHWWTRGRQEIVFSILAKHVSHLGNKNVLDVGCGIGTMLEALSSTGCTNLYGIDNHDLAVDFCQKKGLSVQKSSLISLPFHDNFFDVILAMDVLEHLINEKVALYEISRVLKSGGLLLTTAPAFQFLWSVHDDMNDHLRRYTKKQLDGLITQAGFSIVKSSYFNTFLFPLAFLRKFSSSKQNENLLKPPPSFLNNMLLEVLRVEKSLLSTLNLPFGISLVNIAKKRVVRKQNHLCLKPKSKTSSINLISLL